MPKQKAGIKLYREGDRLYAMDYGEGAKLQGSNENGFDINVGGPIPLLGKTTFFIAGSELAGFIAPLQEGIPS